MSAAEASPNIEEYIRSITERRKTQGLPSMEECQAILEYAAENTSDAVFGIGYYYFAENYWKQNNAEQTMNCLTECSKCFRAAKMYDFLARTYNMMGAVSDRRSNRVVALNYYYTGLQCAEEYELHYVLGMVSMNIAGILMRMDHIAEAAGYYERAAAAYKRSEDTQNRVYNLATCLRQCGVCRLRLGEKDKAYRLWSELVKLRGDFPEKSYPETEIEVFRIECLAAQGKREEALGALGVLLEQFEKTDMLDEFASCLSDIARVFSQYEAYDRLERLFARAEALGLKERLSLTMELYPYRSRYLLHENRMEEYVACTKQYFAAYEKEKVDNRQVAVRVMELQDRLRSVEKEQKRVRAANRRLEALALYDSMTNLANRTLINEHISQKFEEAQQYGRLLGVELLDIDFFKQYNDLYGHLEGDGCIEAVAGVLQSVANDRVFCGRYGGDEFVVIYSDMTAQEVEQTVQTIQNRIREKAIPHKGSACADIVTISQGVFLAVPQEPNREWDFNSMADNALYYAKHKGRNRYHIETEFHKK